MAKGKDAGTPAGRMPEDEHRGEGDGHAVQGKQPPFALSALLSAHAIGMLYQHGAL